MTRTVRVPDPVFEAIERESDRRDVANGVIVRDWMEEAQTGDDVGELLFGAQHVTMGARRDNTRPEKVGDIELPGFKSKPDGDGGADD